MRVARRTGPTGGGIQRRQQRIQPVAVESCRRASEPSREGHGHTSAESARPASTWACRASQPRSQPIRWSPRCAPAACGTAIQPGRRGAAAGWQGHRAGGALLWQRGRRPGDHALFVVASPYTKLAGRFAIRVYEPRWPRTKDSDRSWSCGRR